MGGIIKNVVPLYNITGSKPSFSASLTEQCSVDYNEASLWDEGEKKRKKKLELTNYSDKTSNLKNYF